MSPRTLLCLATLLVAPAIAESATSSDLVVSVLERDVQSLRDRIRATGAGAKEWREVSTWATEKLDGVTAEMEKGRYVLAVDRLASVRNTLLAYWSSNQLGKDASFDSEWQRARGLLEDPPEVSRNGALALQALAEAARVRIRPYHSASRSFAAAASEESGLFYLGRALAHADFIQFCAELGSQEVAPSPELRSIDAELAALEIEVLAAYKPPLSIDRHSDFIELNASVKLARELNDAGALGGALYQYLHAQLRHGTIGAADSEAPSADRIRWGLEEFRERLPEDRDNSIARVFLQDAESALDEGSEGAAAKARVIVDRVLPAYLAVLAAPPTAAGKPASSPDVTVTLVRWPYT